MTQSSPHPEPDHPLLSVANLRTVFETDDGTVRAVDGVSFDLERGKTLGIVGESGSGKSVAALSIMRLIASPPGRIAEGSVEFNGTDLIRLSEAEMRRMRGAKLAMIFQDPMTSLNPFMRISAQLMEMTRLHWGYTRKQALEHAVKMLESVGIPDAGRRASSYPHEFSGGMRQRVMIAMALSCNPELLIADEPTTALDVTIQAQILDLLRRMREETRTSVILISHDLGVVAGMADEIIVMYAGMVFERAQAIDIFRHSGNPYTQGLLKSVPDPAAPKAHLHQIPGLPPDLTTPRGGCPFSPRCEMATETCRNEFPPFVALTPTHFSLCHYAQDVHEGRSPGA